MSIKIQLPSLHQAQTQIKNERARYNVLDMGRRFGKNILLQDLASESALQGQRVGWAAPTYRHMMDDWRELELQLAPIIKSKNSTEKRMGLVTGGVIEFFSLESPDSIRGKKFHRFIVNEAGFASSLMETWNMIIRPTLIDYQGDIYFAGTPKGRNAFYTLFNLDGQRGWKSWKMSSYANPHVPAAELDALRMTMTERAFMQEIMAEFLDDGGGVFRNIQAAAVLQPSEPVQGRQYSIGVDWGRSNDATVFVVMDIAAKHAVFIDRMTDTDFASQRMRLAVLSQRYNNAQVTAESNSIGQPNIEALQMMNVPVTGFTTSNASKAGIIQALQLGFERGEIKIVNDAVLVAELLGFEITRLPSGLLRYSAPDDQHDDCVMALALAYHGATGGQNWYML